MRCDFCGQATQIKKVQKYRYVGIELENVFLDNIEVRFCRDCDLESPIIPKILRLHNTIADAIVCKKSLLSGGEIKFLRKNLRIKSQDWARLLRTDKSVYSRWENEQKISPQSDLLIRYLYLRLLEEKKGIRFEREIAERLAEPSDEKTAIIIDVEQIESYLYLSLDEALWQSKSQMNQIVKFDFELDETNFFLGEIEEPLAFEKMSNSVPLCKSTAVAAANQELALAA